MKLIVPILLIIVFNSTVLHLQEFKSPESAVFDYSGNRYFVSNYGSGDIIQVDSNGVKSYFIQGLVKPLGTIIYDDVLYLVENGNTVRGYKISDASEVLNLKIERVKFLNDITTDSLGHLYITDIGMNKVIRVNLNTKEYSTFINTIYEAPNGIIYEKSGDRLLICYFNDKAAV